MIMKVPHWIIPVKVKIKAEESQKNHPSIERGAERNKCEQQSAPIEKDKSEKNVFQIRLVKQCIVKLSNERQYSLYLGICSKKNV